MKWLWEGLLAQLMMVRSHWEMTESGPKKHCMDQRKSFDLVDHSEKTGVDLMVHIQFGFAVLGGELLSFIFDTAGDHGVSGGVVGLDTFSNHHQPSPPPQNKPHARRPTKKKPSQHTCCLSPPGPHAMKKPVDSNESTSLNFPSW